MSVFFSEEAKAQQSIKLAKYITQLLNQQEEDDASFSSQVKRLIEEKRWDDLMKAMVEKSDVVQSKASEKEFESIMNLIVGFSATIKDDVVGKECRSHLIKVLSTPDKVGIKQKLLMNLYGISQDLQVLKALIRNGSMFDHLELIEQASLQDKRDIYLALADKKDENSYVYLQRYLRTFDQGADKALTKRCIVDAINIPSVMNFEELWQLTAVQSIKDEPEYQWLKVFFNGSLEDFRQLKNGEALGIKDGLRKMRLLTLTSLAGYGDLEYKNIAKELEINESEVEMWVIDAIRAGLLDAKINQLNRTVKVTRATQREFGMDHWKRLQDKLKNWSESLQDLLGVLNNAKLIGESKVQTLS